MDYFDWPSSISRPHVERRKPLIRIVCPVCAVVVTANALDVAGTTDSLCSKCDNTTLTVDTDEEGRITGIAGYDNAKEKVKKTTLDMRYVAGGLGILFLLALFFAMVNASRPVASSNDATPARAAAELASPVKSAAPTPGVKAEQTPPDMFAPERK